MAAEGRITTGSGRTLLFLNMKFRSTVSNPYAQHEDPNLMLYKSVVPHQTLPETLIISNNADRACKKRVC